MVYLFSVVCLLCQGSSNGSSYFDLDVWTGEITLVRPLDYEAIQVHTLIIVATDAAGNTVRRHGFLELDIALSLISAPHHYNLSF